MEQRWNKRFPLAVKVLVVHRGIPVAVCKTRDVSLGGMFIRTGPLSFYKNTTLEVELYLEEGGERRRVRLPVLVAHDERRGLGVMFDTFDSEALGAVRSLLEEHRTEAV